MKARQAIKLGISSCLLGNKVRYDGGHKLDHFLRDTLGQSIEWVPVCPEVEAGLSVPREPMQLVSQAAKPHLITIETRTDRTDDLTRWAGGKLRQLEQEGIRGFVFKARSPSCGVRDAPLYSATGEMIGAGAGLFAEAVTGYFPLLPVEDEERLHDLIMREQFVARVFAYRV